MKGKFVDWSVSYPRLLQLCDISEEEAAKLRDKFFSAFTGLKGCIDEHRKGEGRTPTGLRSGRPG